MKTRSSDPTGDSGDVRPSDTALKLNIVGRRKAGTTLAEHRIHIRQVHGEAVLRYIRDDPDNAPRRYAQNPVFDGIFRAAKPGSDPLALQCDLVTQIWFPDFQSLERSRQTAFYIEHLRDDEDNFVDQPNVVFLPCSERVIVPGRDAVAGAVKLFTLIQRAKGVDAGTFSQAWADAAASYEGSALRHVQNDVMALPGAPMPADAIDEFWFDDEAAARSALTIWQRRIDEVLIQSGLAAEESLVSLLAREDLIYAGQPRD